MDVHGRDLRYFVAAPRNCTSPVPPSGCSCRNRRSANRSAMLERQLGAPLFDRDNRDRPAHARGPPRCCRTPGRCWPRGTRRWAAVEQAKNQSARHHRGWHEHQPRPGRHAAGDQVPVHRVNNRTRSLTLHQVGWHDATAGLADESSDVAFVWLPLPDEDRYAWLVVAEEQRLVALPATRSVGGQRGCSTSPTCSGEPFLALPESAGPAARPLARDRTNGTASPR